MGGCESRQERQDCILEKEDMEKTEGKKDQTLNRGPDSLWSLKIT